MGWIDAEFEVVAGPYRFGERHRHPKLKRWIYAGSPHGIVRWYRRPRFSRPRLFLALCAATPVGMSIVYAVAQLLSHH